LKHGASREFVDAKTFLELDMSSKIAGQKSPENAFMEELVAQLSDPIHKRIIQAHAGADPVQSMESEIGKVFLEILNRKD
jgi:hypothetical protein